MQLWKYPFPFLKSNAVRIVSRVSQSILGLLFITGIKGQDVYNVSLYPLVPDTLVAAHLVYQSLYSESYKSLPQALQRSAQRISRWYHTKDDQFFYVWMVSPEQRTVDDFKESHDTVSLNKLIRSFAIDTTKWSRNPLHNIVFIQVSQLDDNRYIVIPDANNDYSFENDNVYYAKISTDSLQHGILQISEDHNILLRNIEYYFDSTTYKMDYTAGFSLKIYPKPRIRKDSISLCLINENLKEGHVRVNGRAAKVIINQSWLSGVNFDKLSEISFLPDTVQYIPSQSYVRLGDTAFVNNVKLHVTGLSADGHNLSYVQLSQNDTSTFGPQIGDRASDFSLPDEQGNIYQPSHNSKGKYILLDFWGTWCHPCLDNIPNIKKFYLQNNISSPIDYIGVCVDDLTHKDAVLKKIKNIGTPWKNVLVDRADSYSDNRSIVNLYKITGYPTYILISPGGLIISRYVGEDHLPELFQDLSSAKMKRDN